MKHVKLFLLGLILFWLVGFIYVFLTGSNSDKYTLTNGDLKAAVSYFEKGELRDKTNLNFKQLLNDLRLLEEKNQKNELIIQKLQKNSKPVVANDEIKYQNKSLIKNFEQIRRKIFSDVKDVSFYMSSQLSNTLQTKGKQENELNHIKASFQERMNLILVELHDLSKNNGDWRHTAANKLTERVQKEFHDLQNPADCAQAKKIVCDLNKACGYGCQIHHVMYCFITAYFTKRTMILESANWRYNSAGFNAYFKPLSNECLALDRDARPVDWNTADLKNDKLIKMPIIDVLNNKPLFLPLSIPKEFQQELESFHGDPFIWWAGQILFFLTRFNDELEQVVAKKRVDLKFKNSCVGVHVRRTDKVGTEAAFHNLDEYMTEVDQFYNKNELYKAGQQKRCVYLASDEIEVLNEAKSKYKNYDFIFDESNAITASMKERYTPASAQGVILDIYFLSQCEFLVCTFSSQVCRLAYELMQTRFPDASWRFRSLDDVYYYGGQNGHVMVALFDHIPAKNSEEIELKKGDHIGLAGNHWNGFSKGKNFRTNRIGLFPSYKVKDILQIY